MRIGVMGSRETPTLDEMATCDEVKRARVKYVKFRLCVELYREYGHIQQQDSELES